MSAPRVLVCGGRGYGHLYRERRHIITTLDDLYAERGVACVIVGGASGADTYAAMWAHSRGVERVIVSADWGRHGRAAGPIRNQQMLQEHNPDLVVAFPGGSGTADMVRRARASNVPVREITAAPTDSAARDK